MQQKDSVIFRNPNNLDNESYIRTVELDLKAKTQYSYRY
jgi:hypothetical protein